MQTEAATASRSFREALRKLVDYAVLAPSSHNTQPWRFRITDHELQLFADRTRALSVNDPFDRELTISCGAALYNVRLAIRHLGRAAAVALLPVETEPDLLATVSFGGPIPFSEEEHRQFEAIPLRRTYRRVFSSRDVGDDVLAELRAAAQEEGAWFHVATGDQRSRIAELVAEADRELWANPAWRRELAAWMHPRRSGDGIALPEVAAAVAPFIIRTFDTGTGEAAKDLELARGSPVLAVMGTGEDDPAAWLRAGQALQRVLLTACGHKLQASFLNQPNELGALRARLAAAIESNGAPQLVLRFGHPTEELRASPRRPVSAVID